MTLTEVLEQWVGEAERMDNGPARAIVVTGALFAQLAEEADSHAPVVAGLPVSAEASDLPATDDMPSLAEMVEISGPDRVCIYVGPDPAGSTFPWGHDPAMPVFFVPVPPAHLPNGAALEMYNRLRWYGLEPDEALTGSGG